MKKISYIIGGIFITVASLVALAVSAQERTDTELLESSIRGYIADKDARIGVAVIIDGRDTAEVNGGQFFPMLSVYKFPQALAVAEHCRRHGVGLADTVRVSADEMKSDTWSPMRDRFGAVNVGLPLRTLLEYSLQQSDNNACDVLFRMIGGPAVADSLMNKWGYGDIRIRSTEDEMHRDTDLCLVNCCTPLEMARLLDDFNTGIRVRSEENGAIASLMENCATGRDRLASPLTDTPAILGHKTGTGDVDSQGRLIAVNDAGYVNLPDGRRYVVAVFIASSAYGLDETSRMIADISEIVYSQIAR